MSQKRTPVGSPLLSMSSGLGATTTLTVRPSPVASGTLASYGSTDTLRAASSANAISVTVDRPTTPQVSAHGYTSTPTRGRPVSFIAPLHVPARFQPSYRAKLDLYVGQFISFLISSFFLSLVVAWACLARLSLELPRWLRPVKPATFPWDKPEYFKTEKVVKDVQTYAEAVGLQILDEQVETADGYYLRCVIAFTCR
jgi:lysosomal acid lipase/cholesteryl ester hydrolase